MRWQQRNALILNLRQPSCDHVDVLTSLTALSMLAIIAPIYPASIINRMEILSWDRRHMHRKRFSKTK
ncbi:hypothetical protein BDZ91DRAFT_255980 [Kalaharituber pfeilii]|nr:hypothetical protein BDZ91DRAFT_255980 [Kalaharituber pfeilii]